MNTGLGHIQVNVQPPNLPFYRDLFGFLGWQTLYDGDGMLGVMPQDGGASLWCTPATKNAPNDYDGPGMNHLGINAPSQVEVDSTAAWLRERNIPTLFETPRHRPEFAAAEDQTYYQVMFETPDRLLIEVVYTGPK